MYSWLEDMKTFRLSVMSSGSISMPGWSGMQILHLLMYFLHTGLHIVMFWEVLLYD